MKTIELGIMQGRLLPKYNGRYQAHPTGYWQEEFPVAASLGVKYIEFILDHNEVDLNPLMTREGLNTVKRAIQTTGVTVRSVCADYFMEAPLHHLDREKVKSSSSVLLQLMKNCHEIGVKDIVIPCVDHSSLYDEAAQDRFVGSLMPFQEIAEKLDINISLETDLAPKSFKELLERFGSDKITVNYDTGNSAALGYDPIDEFEAYGERISDIHIKDRLLGGGSVVLGTGSVDFHKFFQALATINYSGPIVMQVFRDDEGVEVFKTQLTWFKSLANKLWKR